MKLKRKEDRIVDGLKELFDQYGYRYYKMRKFEGYSLYMENRSFLSDENIITFNHNGKLLALKPDVTLSIVKNAKAYVGRSEKLYYKESVFRYNRKSEEYKEVNQIGLEVMGNVDITTDCEIISLALKSLKIISDSFMLCISNTGIISGIFEYLKIESYEIKKSIINCIKNKSKHELKNILDNEAITEEGINILFGLIDGIIPDINETKDAYETLNKTLKCMYDLGYEKNIKVDFSVINDLDYYTGIVFNGYIDEIPNVILSGGRYDGLVQKFGANVNAEGFAIYLDDLLYLNDETEYDVDVLLIKSAESNPFDVLNRAEEIIKGGESVRIETGTSIDVKYRRKEFI